MCGVCGCGEAEVRVEGEKPGHHHHDHDHDHDHGHGHGHAHGHGHSHDPAADGVSPAQAQASRLVRIEQDILSKNDQYAQVNRRYFADKGLLALNLVSSPGSGKTTLLVETLKRLGERLPLAVIEGDQQTSQDAQRIRATGSRAVQINTGKGCHLDAHMVGHALEQLADLQKGVLFIENVGNLVCPAGFDLGEAHKVVILSVTEGEDKPLKYPDMFHAADLLVLNKIDLLPYVDFSPDTCLDYVHRINPQIETLMVSAKTGEGLDQWLEWVLQQWRGTLQSRLSQLRGELAELESLLN